MAHICRIKNKRNAQSGTDAYFAVLTARALTSSRGDMVS